MITIAMEKMICVFIVVSPSRSMRYANKPPNDIKPFGVWGRKLLAFEESRKTRRLVH